MSEMRFHDASGRPLHSTAKVVEVIEVTVPRGCGLGGHDIFRSVKQWFTTDGIFLAEHDPGPTLNGEGR